MQHLPPPAARKAPDRLARAQHLAEHAGRRRYTRLRASGFGLLAPVLGDYVILPEVISNEPLTLVARPDQAFEASLFWAFQVMLNADAHGITSANVGAIVADLAQQPADVQRLFGSDSATTDMAAKLGLPKDWAYQVVKQVGSYGEVFDRTSAPPRPSVWTGPRRSTPMWGMAA